MSGMDMECIDIAKKKVNSCCCCVVAVCWCIVTFLDNSLWSVLV